MSAKYKEFSGLNLPALEKEVLKQWEEDSAFEKSVSLREGALPFVFYEGPPSANGMPGIHHVISRTLKDLVCRYKTMQGFQVKRKGGWDTHGLPVELGVEKELGITKEDIGKKISVEEYNQKCREAVLRYKDKWDDLTKKMGYWVDLNDPYITFENGYIETLWWILKQLYDKNLLYESVSIQPYSPAAGTGLSSHELNQPGCYKEVKDTSCVAMFKAVKNEKSEFLFDSIKSFAFREELGQVFFMAWTTTPWTLPSNLGLTLGGNIDYVLTKLWNQYSKKWFNGVLAKNLLCHIVNDKYLQELVVEGLYKGIKEYRIEGNKYIADGYVKRDDKEYFIEVKTGNFKIGEGIEQLNNLIEKMNAKGVFFSYEPIPNNQQEKYPNIEFRNYIEEFLSAEFKGKDLEGISYEQILPYEANKINNPNSFKILLGDFVTTEDGTGIVHTAPAFGADDFKVGKKYDIGILTMVDEQGRFLKGINDGIFLYREEYLDNYGIIDFRGEKVKEDYLTEYEKEIEFQKQKRILEAQGKVKDLKKYLSVDDRIVLKLQEENKLFKKEKYEHSYPHCWRTDKPILYYPLDAWFIKTTKLKDRMVELNKTINWKPKSTGEGRFGNWLENMVDWNLSRSRFWGTPLPVWRNQVHNLEICIGSINELKENGYLFNKKQFAEDYKRVEFNLANKVSRFFENHPNPERRDRTFRTFYNVFSSPIENLYSLIAVDFRYSVIKDYLTPLTEIKDFDLHKPYVDDVFVVKDDILLNRVSDLVDVWFDSGAMPYAQWHYPFENKDLIDNNLAFPADFIAEGVDQTRGWFYTLHALGVLLFDSVAYKTCVSNGLVLDKNGVKMSKRLGNIVDPFLTINTYGADATRWYLITNASPWDNLKFDLAGIQEVQRKFFGTLYNTYQFFALYANVDGFAFKESYISLNERPEIDRWILSSLNTLIKKVIASMDDYEPTQAGRFIEEFVDEHLSNWYVRLCRRRFWKGEYEHDKICAYQTLYECLETLTRLIAPISPFFSDAVFKNLEVITNRSNAGSVHHTNFPKANEEVIDVDLEERMQLAQDASSLILSLRKKVNIKVRQPLQKIYITALNLKMRADVLYVQDLIKSEVNVKEVIIINAENEFIKRRAKANYKVLGKKVGKRMKQIASEIENLSDFDIGRILDGADFLLNGLEYLEGEQPIYISKEDIEPFIEEIPGFEFASKGNLTVALDITITAALQKEGEAREFVNRIQNIRKETGFALTDRILLDVSAPENISNSLIEFKNYICAEILADNLSFVSQIDGGTEIEVNDTLLKVRVIKKG